MKPTLFRCPVTHQLVQHFLAETTDDADKDRYDTVQCLACGRFHMVNVVTGKLLGQKD